MISSGVLSRRAAEIRTLVSISTFMLRHPIRLNLGRYLFVSNGASLGESLSLAEERLQLGKRRVLPFLVDQYNNFNLLPWTKW